MFTFAIRPAYKSKELLLEFLSGSGSDEMIVAMREALKQFNSEVAEKIDLWENDEIIYKMKSNIGEFEISSNNYNDVFIHATTNQAAIQKIGAALISSQLFQEETVDYEKYA